MVISMQKWSPKFQQVVVCFGRCGFLNFFHSQLLQISLSTSLNSEFFDSLIEIDYRYLMIQNQIFMVEQIFNYDFNTELS